MSVQNELLGDVPEHSSNGLNLHLMSVTVPAFPDGDSKGEESVREDVRVMDFAGGHLDRVRNALATLSRIAPVRTHPLSQCQSLSMQSLEDVGFQPARHCC